MGILKPYLIELLVSSLEAETNLPISVGGSTAEARPARQEVLWEWYPGEPEQMAPQESCFEGDSAHPNQLLTVCCTQQIFSFQHNLMVRGSGSLKLGIVSLELSAVSLVPGTWEKPFTISLLRGEARSERTGTHQLGAFVSAIPREDESVLARGNGHHRRVDQAQLHDAGVVGSQGGRVVEADP